MSRQPFGEPTFRTLLIDEAARLMGVSRRTVYYRIRDGSLDTIKTRCGSTRVVVRSLDALVRLGVRRNAAARPSAPPGHEP
jgi:excisionase family DNA binding protein